MSCENDPGRKRREPNDGLTEATSRRLKSEVARLLEVPTEVFSLCDAWLTGAVTDENFEDGFSDLARDAIPLPDEVVEIAVGVGSTIDPSHDFNLAVRLATAVVTAIEDMAESCPVERRSPLIRALFLARQLRDEDLRHFGASSHIGFVGRLMEP